MTPTEFRVTIGEITGMRPRKRGHDGKAVFKSEGAAWAAIRSLARRGGREYGAMLKDGQALKPYPCSVDGPVHWHYGHVRGQRG